jgi:hypothetical protein
MASASSMLLAAVAAVIAGVAVLAVKNARK